MSSLLWVIDPAVEQPEDEGYRELEQLFGGRCERFLVALDETIPLPRSYRADAVVVLGSKASARDHDPWVLALRDWLAPIVRGDERLPTLGICFGHQLIGRIAGAAVDFLRPDQSKLVAIEESRIVASRLFDQPATLQVICSHREVVTEVPAGFVRVGSRRDVPNDVFEHEHLPIVTAQFHPEARATFLQRAGLDASRLSPTLLSDSRRFLRGFFALARSSAP
ncbi:MAG: gamma-glutamyl-gamma-aminobutyrate hydrolase family protein [Myxococcales bacterium]|nr:gamma-glutamyl-gamma-aminobutyrate hydrolase family protein [Myxococcales bacterium]